MIITLSGKIVGGSRLVINDNINVFLATQSNLWSNANNWSLGVIPSQNQTAIIRANCTVDTNFTVKNLTVEDTRTISFNTFTGTINNDFTCNGNLNQSGFTSNLVLNGINNSVTGTFTSGTLSTITYGRNGNQNVLNLSYNNLSFTTGGIKYATNNLIVNNLTGNATLECLSFNLTVSGIVSGGGGTLSKNGAGNILFIGTYGASNQWVFANFTGNPTVEFRSGISNNAGANNWGTSNILFTTNSQSITSQYQNTIVFNNVTIGSGVTLTNSTAIGNLATFTQGLHVNSITGTNTTSVFTNAGRVTFDSSTTPMVTGTFNMGGVGTCLGYSFNGNFTLPYTTYNFLTFSGTGTKSLSGTTTINNDCILGNQGTFECSTFDFTANGSCDGGAIFSKTGSGNLLFKGAYVSNRDFGGLLSSFTGNPTVEFRNGITYNSANNFGLGNISFTTNNQSIIKGYGNILTFNNNITIVGAISLFINTGVVTIFAGTITGSVGGSILNNIGSFEYTNDAVLMATGQFKTDQSVNTVIYNKVSTLQTIRIPDDANYRNLTLIGNTSTKTVGGGGTVNVRNTRTINTGVTVVGTITNTP